MEGMRCLQKKKKIRKPVQVGEFIGSLCGDECVSEKVGNLGKTNRNPKTLTCGGLLPSDFVKD